MPANKTGYKCLAPKDLPDLSKCEFKSGRSPKSALPRFFSGGIVLKLPPIASGQKSRAVSQQHRSDNIRFVLVFAFLSISLATTQPLTSSAVTAWPTHALDNVFVD